MQGESGRPLWQEGTSVLWPQAGLGGVIGMPYGGAIIICGAYIGAIICGGAAAGAAGAAARPAVAYTYSARCSLRQPVALGIPPPYYTPRPFPETGARAYVRGIAGKLAHTLANIFDKLIDLIIFM